MSRKLKAPAIAPLLNFDLQGMFNLAKNDELPLTGSDSFALFSLQDTFSYADVLMTELALQLSDDDGMPLQAASRMVWNAGLSDFVARPIGLPHVDDYWIGIARNRNSWGTSPRGSWPVTRFGPDEYWSSAHFSGALTEICQSAGEYFRREELESPDSDPARIFLVNVSTADRRLRKRAAKLGIEIVGNDFA